MEKGSSFDGSNIQFIYQTPEFQFEDPELRKVLYKIKVFTQTQGNIEVTLNLDFTQNCSQVRNPPAFSLSASSGSARYGEAVYDTDVYAGLSNPIICRNLRGSGESVSLTFAGNNIEEPFRIDSFILQYNTQGRR
jgi:hypothetical protein